MIGHLDFSIAERYGLEQCRPWASIVITLYDSRCRITGRQKSMPVKRKLCKEQAFCISSWRDKRGCLQIGQRATQCMSKPLNDVWQLGYCCAVCSTPFRPISGCSFNFFLIWLFLRIRICVWDFILVIHVCILVRICINRSESPYLGPMPSYRLPNRTRVHVNSSQMTLQNW